MGYTKSYNQIIWKNNEETPLNEANLNKIDYAMNEVDNRTIELETKKLDINTAYEMLKDITYNEANGVLIITRLNGTKLTIDTKLEKLAVNFTYNPKTGFLTIALDDGTEQCVDLSSLISEYEFTDSETIAFALIDGKVKANIKKGSITGEHLEPNYLADITVAMQTAKGAATTSVTCADNAKKSENNTKISEITAEASKKIAVTAENNVKASETNTKTSEANAKTSENNAKSSESKSATSAALADTSAVEAKNSATKALASVTSASKSATNAEGSATLAKSYSIGATGARVGEDTDNAKYYAEQAQKLSNVPTKVSQLENDAKYLTAIGNASNTTNAFTTASSRANLTTGEKLSTSLGKIAKWLADLKSGAFANITNNLTATTAGSLLDATQGKILNDTVTTHTSATNNPHSVTKSQVGLGSVPNVSTNNQAPTYTEATELAELASGEKMSVAFSKLKLIAKNVIANVKLLGTTDISAIGDGTVTGAVNVFNDKFNNINIRLFNSPESIGLSEPTSAVKTCLAMPRHSIALLNGDQITDAPNIYSTILIYKIGNERCYAETTAKYGERYAMYITPGTNGLSGTWVEQVQIKRITEHTAGSYSLSPNMYKDFTIDIKYLKFSAPPLFFIRDCRLCTVFIKVITKDSITLSLHSIEETDYARVTFMLMEI